MKKELEEKVEKSIIYIILDNGLSVELEFPEDVLEEVVTRLSKAMEYGCQFSMEDYCDCYMSIGDEMFNTLNGKRIIGYQY